MPSSSEHRNRLAAEKSPYLLQHAANPVDWYPWGEEALRRAQTEDKPIFLSIGYSTCHWCHVMERESFENEAIAAYLNEHFVCIKVDREERPDLDNLYMTAVQAMTGSGGWPMSVFLTPELKPFFAGTYFPPEDRYGRPGFPSLLHRIVELWNGDRSELLASSEQVADFLRRQAAPAGDVAAETLTAAFQDTLARDLERLFDGKRGGFSGAPKFPTPHKVSWLLRHHARTGSKRSLEMARVTLDAMANGGIHDHLAGGFHRYSTDATWLVPHFEKMLYDQAGLALAYVDGWLATADPNYEAVARGTLDYVLAYLTDPAGGFRSAEDADSEGVEGKFYVWSAAEIDALLGPEAGERFRTAYRVTAAGNWEGVNILHTAELGSLRDPAMIEARRTLLAARDRRIRPHLDDKIVTAWNGFMIEAFARAGRAFDEPRYVDAAVRASEFVDEHLRRDGRLLRHHRGGAADVPGFLDDYAFLGRGWLALYETTGDPRWLAGSIGLARDLVRLFGRPEGGFVYSGADAETLLAPVVETYDGAMPSGNSAAATFLLRLGHLTADPALKDAGWGVLRAFSPLVRRSPVSFVDLAAATDFAAGPAIEIVLAGDPDDPALRAMRRAVATRHLPQAVTAHHRPGDAAEAAKLISYLSAQGPIDGRATAYVCRDYACRLPVHDADALAHMLETETARQPAR